MTGVTGFVPEELGICIRILLLVDIGLFQPAQHTFILCLVLLPKPLSQDSSLGMMHQVIPFLFGEFSHRTMGIKEF